MTKILIAGGAGYIGNVLTDTLLDGLMNDDPRVEVTVFDNLIHRNGAILEQCGTTNFDFVYGDVRNQELYGKLNP
jgi:nucleoside-diphosphate-sugar epimerase